MSNIICISVSIVTGMVASVLFLKWGHKIYNKRIVLKHDIDPRWWFFVHPLVFSISISLMLVSDLLTYWAQSIPEMPFSIVGLTVAFIKNGGFIVIVMLCSSLLYNRYIKVSEYQYFVQRHLWIKKLFFTITCISPMTIYVIEIVRIENINNILSDDYQFVFVWIIMLLQIWIGFGMNSYSTKEICCKLKCEIEEITQEKGRKEFFYCVLSMLFMPIFMILLFVTKKCINEMIVTIVSSCTYGVFLGVSFGAVFFATMLFKWNRKYIPNQNNSCKKLTDAFYSLNTTGIKMEYFMGVEYEIGREDMVYYLHVHKRALELSNPEDFSSDFRAKIINAYDGIDKQYSLDKYSKIEIVDKIKGVLLSKAETRRDLLKEGWDIVYRVFERKEIIYNRKSEEKKQIYSL